MIVCLVQNFQFPFFPYTQTKQNRNTLAYFTFHFVLETHKTVFKDIYRISCDIKNIQPKVIFKVWPAGGEHGTLTVCNILQNESARVWRSLLKGL
uniref:Uncharacterized protein n=1 Tax=Anguilla anguilla TaxID=7936 RepID=A0A0E9WTZ1_ANGAN